MKDFQNVLQWSPIHMSPAAQQRVILSRGHKQRFSQFAWGRSSSSQSLASGDEQDVSDESFVIDSGTMPTHRRAGLDPVTQAPAFPFGGNSPCMNTEMTEIGHCGGHSKIYGQRSGDQEYTLKQVRVIGMGQSGGGEILVVGEGEMRDSGMRGAGVTARENVRQRKNVEHEQTEGDRERQKAEERPRWERECKGRAQEPSVTASTHTEPTNANQSSTSQHPSGSTPLRYTPSSSGTTRMPSSENTHKSTGWRGATNDPFHGGSRSYVPPTESEWKRKQEEQARQQQEQFRRDSMKAEQEYMSRATFSTGKDSIVRAWTKYESDWTSLKDRTTLRLRIIPWPLLKSISSPDEITANAVGALVLSPHHSPDKKARDRLKEQLLRWHPDRFEGKWLQKVAEEDKEEMKKGVGQVARALNELTNRENNPFG